MKHIRSTAVLTAALMTAGMVLPVQVQGAPEESWAIYLYLCGSNLESEGAAATADLMEILDVDLPDEVTVVVETGGAVEWQNDVVDPNYLERYVYDSDGEMVCVEQAGLANMGDPDTLADFLSFCQTNYPADREAVIFWDHGGGSVSGAVFDENYGYDSLTLEEFRQAFEQVYDLSGEPPFEMIGFDACLMATVDTANTFKDIAKYMVASEESEPGCGWAYNEWLNTLAWDPSLDGAEVGKAICDSYLAGCQEYSWGAEDEATLSVLDLSKTDALLEAFDEAGKEAIGYLYEDPSYYTEFARAAKNAVNFGGNTASSGYTNLVDMGDLMLRTADSLPKNSEQVRQALDEMVIYSVNGAYKEGALGLSCFFSLDSDPDTLAEYTQISCGQYFNDFYTYSLTGEITTEMDHFLMTEDLAVEEIQDVPILAEYYEEGDTLPVSLDEDDYAVLTVDEDTLNTLTGVYFQLAIIEEEEDFEIWLGYDNDLDMDWENGIFTDNFRGVWGSIDGHICYMTIDYEGEDYNLYLVPILLNGEEYQLHVVYDYNDDEYYILGARKGLDEYGASDRNLLQLMPGDEITILAYAASYYGDEEPELYEFETFEVDEDTSFYEAELGDGEYEMLFELEDCRGNVMWSDPVYFTVDGYDIYAELEQE